MKTAQEILMEQKLARMANETKEKEWNNLISRCRDAKWQGPFWFQLFMISIVSGYLLSAGRPGDYRQLAAVFALFIFWCFPAHLISQRRKSKALLAIIQQKAPQLYRRLEDENIA